MSVGAVKVHRADWQNLPRELRHNRRQWVVAELETKIPRDANKTPLGWASTTDPATWSTFEQCVEKTGPKLGLGFVLSRQDCYVVVDLDWKKGPDAGEKYKIPAWAAELLAELDAQYLEWSVSGRGAHAIVVSDQMDLFGNGSGGGKRLWSDSQGVEHQVEIYSHDRYFLLTGNLVRPERGRIVGRTDQLAELVENSRPLETLRPGEKDCGCGGGKDHTVNADLMLELLAGLGIVLGRGRDKGKFFCPFHDTSCGAPTFHVDRRRGFHCFGASCGLQGGAQALLKKIATLTDAELDAVAARTGQPRDGLEKLRDRCLGTGMSQQYIFTSPGVYKMNSCDKNRLNPCGGTVLTGHGDHVRATWQECGSWNCPWCGPRKRAEYEGQLLGHLGGEPDVFYQVIPEGTWQRDGPQIRQKLSRAKGLYKWFKTEQVGARAVLSTVDLGEFSPPRYGGSYEVKREDHQQVVQGLLKGIRKKADRNERLVGGSRAWAMRTQSDEAREKGTLLGFTHCLPEQVHDYIAKREIDVELLSRYEGPDGKQHYGSLKILVDETAPIVQEILGAVGARTPNQRELVQWQNARMAAWSEPRAAAWKKRVG